MATVVLVRHGRTTANASGVLAGWTEGVELDEAGRAQAESLGSRFTGTRVVCVVSSPLERCRQTARAICAATGAAMSFDDRLGEARYGDWTGQRLAELSRSRLWRAVQEHPSSVRFPGPDGEAMAAVQARAVDCVREHDRAVTAEHGDAGAWVAVSHGDVIKAVLADALGMHLDLFQRIVVDPASVSVIRYTERRPFVVRLNDTGSTLASLTPTRGRRRRASSDAPVGGGAGES